jgi:hypothetical protein
LAGGEDREERFLREAAALEEEDEGSAEIEVVRIGPVAARVLRVGDDSPLDDQENWENEDDGENGDDGESEENKENQENEEENKENEEENEENEEDDER